MEQHWNAARIRHIYRRDSLWLAAGDVQTAVAITAGTTYVASYFAPNGHYSVNSGYFASAGVDNGPLHLLQNGVDGGNGVFIYGPTGGFPNNTFQSGNYWVDVAFNTTPGSPTGPTVLSTSPASGASGVSTATSVSAVFSQDLNPATVTSSTFRLLDPSNNPIPASVTYNAGTATARLTSSFSAKRSYPIYGGNYGWQQWYKEYLGNSDVLGCLVALHDRATCKLPLFGVDLKHDSSHSGFRGDAGPELGVKFRSDMMAISPVFVSTRAPLIPVLISAICGAARNPSRLRHIYRRDSLWLAAGDVSNGGCDHGRNHLRGIVFCPERPLFG